MASGPGRSFGFSFLKVATVGTGRSQAALTQAEHIRGLSILALTPDHGSAGRDGVVRLQWRRPVADLQVPTGMTRLWTWPGLLIPVIAAIVVVTVVLSLILG